MPAAWGAFVTVLLALLSCSSAWELKHKQQINVAHHVSSLRGEACKEDGHCKPALHTVKAHSLWLWCGWSGQHSYEYEVTAVTQRDNITKPKVVVANKAPFLIPGSQSVLSTMVMQQDAAESCVPEFFGGCQYISNSECLFSHQCARRLNGRLLGGHLCLGVVNDSDDDVQFLVQAKQSSQHNELVVVGVTLMATTIVAIGTILRKLSATSVRERKQPLLGL